MVQWIVDQCVSVGIRQLVFSPGSRNSPFAIAFHAEPRIQIRVVHDERAAAFIALGLAQTLQEPVALCCTSGSACLNYYPAIAEAYYRNIPLLAITADRPAEWINQGDGQTIVQKEVFGAHALAYLELDESGFGTQPSTETQHQMQAFLQHLSADWKGPIQLNVGLNEPLYQQAPRQHFPLLSKQESTTKLAALPDFSCLSHQKIMILIGQMTPNSRFERALQKLATNSNVVVLVENTSNVQDERFNACIDRSLNGFEHVDPSYRPDVLLSFGGAIVSKRIKAYLRQQPVRLHWRIAFDFPEMDTYRCLTQHVALDGADFLEALIAADCLPACHNYFGKWKGLDYHAKDQAATFDFEQESLTDIAVYDAFMQQLKGPAILHLANSSVVRYAQLFDPIQQVRYESNRGTSGIDGSVSTAVGAALAKPEHPHYLLCGDISLIYDSNAFWTRPFPKNLKILVIQNFGGGIFKIIPGPAASELCVDYFEAKHQQDPAQLAAAFGIKTTCITKFSELTDALLTWIDPSNDIQLLQVQTNDALNANELERYFSHLKQPFIS
ncbi:MAG: 2-succinyl-5-enolpyruvyl-6-hydroxy-3-cyclohexene-carboxylic-acid synthase [Bacteroidota bacterium]|jgi:2-succinyl-5-enolpyruvyl-6-hydroxy-3-cyclohexene-1-carboxylate synthase